MHNPTDRPRPVCLGVCRVRGGQTLAPRKRPCFPYLTTAERVSPWLQAALFHGPGVCVHCSLRVWRNITCVPVVPVYRSHNSSAFYHSLLSSGLHARAPCTFQPFNSTSNRPVPGRGSIGIQQNVAARVRRVLIEQRTGERDTEELKRGRMRERNAPTGIHIA